MQSQSQHIQDKLKQLSIAIEDGSLSPVARMLNGLPAPDAARKRRESF